MLQILLIVLGAAAGTLSRYGVSLACARSGERLNFPLGTLAVNLLGCFMIGFLNGLFLDRVSIRSDVRAALIIGFLGGFTTFSSYGWESFTLLKDRETFRFAANFLANNVAGVMLVILGYTLARR